MLWIPVEEREPPCGQWIQLTNCIEKAYAPVVDGEITWATWKLCPKYHSKRGSGDYCRDMGYTHWRYVDTHWRYV
jgi:hypothetical protein